MVNIDPTGLALQMGGSAVIGAVIGFAAKKVAKILAIIVGIELVILKFLESRGVLTVNWGRLVDATENSTAQAPAAAQSLVDTFISTAGIGVGFAGGFYLGMRRG